MTLLERFARHSRNQTARGADLSSTVGWQTWLTSSDSGSRDRRFESFLASQHHNIVASDRFRPPDDVVLRVTDGISKEARRCEVRLTLPRLVRLILLARRGLPLILGASWRSESGPQPTSSAPPRRRRNLAADGRVVPDDPHPCGPPVRRSTARRRHHRGRASSLAALSFGARSRPSRSPATSAA